MPKNAYLLQQQIKRAKEDELLRQITSTVTEQQTMDKVILTLGDLGVTSGNFYRKFYERFQDIEKDYCRKVVDDGASDKDIEYSSDYIDRCLKQIVPEDLFCPHDKRFELFCPADELLAAIGYLRNEYEKNKDKPDAIGRALYFTWKVMHKYIDYEDN